MPNTLAHIGINGLVTRKLIKDADLKWVYLGVVIPDLPWILQRIVLATIPTVLDVYDLRLYCVAQASLFISLTLCAAFASFSNKPVQCFNILSLGALLHYALDSIQIKWANGVNVLAPFDWELFNVGLFWPESNVNYALSAGGLLYWLWHAKSASCGPWNIHIFPLKRIVFALFMTSFYLLLPVIFLDGPASVNAHFTTTLRNGPEINDPVEFDRADLLIKRQSPAIKPFTGQEFIASGLMAKDEQLISIKGHFDGDKSVVIEKYHIHSRFRDYASYLGLSLILLSWCINGTLFAYRSFFRTP